MAQARALLQALCGALDDPETVLEDSLSAAAAPLPDLRAPDALDTVAAQMSAAEAGEAPF